MDLRARPNVRGVCVCLFQSLDSVGAAEEARSKRHSASELGSISYSDVRREGWLHYKQILTEKGKVGGGTCREEGEEKGKVGGGTCRGEEGRNVEEQEESNHLDQFPSSVPL